MESLIFGRTERFETEIVDDQQRRLDEGMETAREAPHGLGFS